MGDDAEYRRLVREKTEAQNRLRTESGQRGAIQDKIDRLKDAKRILSDEYGYFSGVKSTVEGKVRGIYAWKGAKYDVFSGYASSLMEANKNYYDNLDNARDAINSEIGRLENQLYSQDGLLGQLRSLINTLARKIENFFND